MRNIPWADMAPPTAPVPESLSRIAHDLSLVFAYRSWVCDWEQHPAPFPEAARLRIGGSLRTRHRVLTVDLMRRSDAASSWPAIREHVRRTRDEAAVRNEEYYLMTERAVTPVLRSNLERLLDMRLHHPTRDVERAVYDACPTDSAISLGILAARAARGGIDIQAAEAAATWLLSMDVLRGDLRQPLGRAFHLRRLERFGRPPAAQPLPRPHRRIPPPWILPS